MLYHVVEPFPEHLQGNPGTVPAGALPGSLRLQEPAKGLEDILCFFASQWTVEGCIRDVELHLATVMEVSRHHLQQRPCINVRGTRLGDGHWQPGFGDGPDKYGGRTRMQSD